MADFDKETYNRLRQETLELYKHSGFQELKDLALIELPNDLQQLFSNTNDLYNSRGRGSPFDDIRDRSQKSSDTYAHSLLFGGVQEGISGCFYHCRQFTRIEGLIRQKGMEIFSTFKPSKSITLDISGQKLTFEYESFMFLSRATLDRLNWLFNYYFLSDARNLYKLVPVLKSKSVNSLRATRILQVIEDHRDFLNTQIGSEKGQTERDKIAHKEHILFVVINIIYDRATETVKVLLVSPDGTVDEASLVLLDRLNNLKMFVTDAISAFSKPV